mmetsp:Transcript_9977/g.37202  ORF Transcript_9977/g.37202 Transcript_9977/m.37202 type:complete len:218 (+) Transcript_9977:482-1135(+)
MTILRVQFKLFEYHLGKEWIILITSLEVWIVLLLVGDLVIEEIPLKGGHLVLSKKRRFWSAPQVPHNVWHFTLVFPQKELVPCELIHLFEESLSRIGSPIESDLGKHEITICVLLHWHEGMSQQIAIVLQVQGTFVKEELHVTLHLFRVNVRTHQLLHHFLLVLIESLRIGRINSWKMSIIELVALSIHKNSSIIEINVSQHETVLHLEVRVPINNL